MLFGLLLSGMAASLSIVGATLENIDEATKALERRLNGARAQLHAWHII